MTLVYMRISQTVGLAFLFVPISTIAYATLPRTQNADAAALFTMFRNVAGSIGISAASAMITERSQVRQAHLVPYLSDLNPNYNALVQQNERGLLSLGRAPAVVHDQAVNHVFTQLQNQYQILAYADVFLFCSVIAFTVVPLCFLFSGIKAGRGAPAGGH